MRRKQKVYNPSQSPPSSTRFNRPNRTNTANNQAALSSTYRTVYHSPLVPLYNQPNHNNEDLQHCLPRSPCRRRRRLPSPAPRRRCRGRARVRSGRRHPRCWANQAPPRVPPPERVWPLRLELVLELLLQVELGHVVHG